MKTKILQFIKSPLWLLRKMYNWTLHWAKTKQAPYALFWLAFCESSFFPIPPDVLLIAMVMAERKKWAFYAMICTIGSVCGALLGYFIGLGLYETIGKVIINTYHLNATVELVGRKFAENSFITIFTAAFTPIPYKVITIAAGIFNISLAVVVIASIFGRAGRFFLVALGLRVFGKKIADSIEKYFDILSIIFVLLLVGGFWIIKHFAK
ncbi:MAG: DedA family protein [Candidatus Omnitrophica bacterium]|nr:DedA family protein [Candidatus Omnitrophota bacterium]